MRHITFTQLGAMTYDVRRDGDLVGVVWRDRDQMWSARTAPGELATHGHRNRGAAALALTAHAHIWTTERDGSIGGRPAYVSTCSGCGRVTPRHTDGDAR